MPQNEIEARFGLRSFATQPEQRALTPSCTEVAGLASTQDGRSLRADLFDIPLATWPAQLTLFSSAASVQIRETHPVHSVPIATLSRSSEPLASHLQTTPATTPSHGGYETSRPAARAANHRPVSFHYFPVVLTVS